MRIIERSNFSASRLFLVVAFCWCTLAAVSGQAVATKTIDGPFSSLAVTEQSLADFVVYRPEYIDEAVRKTGSLPVMVWANGGCMNSSIHHERLLAEVASHGYVIIAIGSLQMTVEEREHEHTPDDELLKALDWIFDRGRAPGNDYSGNVDLDKVAVGGMSCGGAQVFRVADDERIKSYLIFNAGMGDMTMAGASAQSLQNLHASVLYLLGGKSDIAYSNAEADYAKINHVPVAFASHQTAGHGGTFAEPNGGSFARMALDWLDWQFKGEDKADVFLQNALDDYPDWTMKAKGFSTLPGETQAGVFSKPELEFVCELQVTIGEPMNLGPALDGERVIIPITGGTFAGPKMKGTVLDGGADYQSISANGERVALNAIYTIKTNDDVLIQVQNTGILHSPARNDESGNSEVYFRAAPKFTAPVNSDYAWLNNAIFICKPEGRERYISIQVWKVL